MHPPYKLELQSRYYIYITVIINYLFTATPLITIQVLSARGVTQEINQST